MVSCVCFVNCFRHPNTIFLSLQHRSRSQLALQGLRSAQLRPHLGANHADTHPRVEPRLGVAGHIQREMRKMQPQNFKKANLKSMLCFRFTHNLLGPRRRLVLHDELPVQASNAAVDELDDPILLAALATTLLENHELNMFVLFFRNINSF